VLAPATAVAGGTVDGVGDQITDEELTALALAADPDQPIPHDAVSLWELDPARSDPLLPDWYMPAAAGGVGAGPGWRRRVGLLVIGSFLAINAAGLCSTYGHIVIA
jgi:hypothetical protein